MPIASPGIPRYWGDESDPLVIVVPDLYGRLPALEGSAEQLAESGFRVAASDLYNGVATVSTDEAEKLMAAVDVDIALAELDDVIADARARGSQKVGIVGYSLGGRLALLLAQRGSVDAVVAYYASLAPADHGVVPAPVLLHYAERDDWSDDTSPADFVERLKAHGTPVTEHSYLGTAHSFANAAIADRFEPRATALADARTESFLSLHLLE
jgi:carboxymethylenebutenolidase